MILIEANEANENDLPVKAHLTSDREKQASDCAPRPSCSHARGRSSYHVYMQPTRGDRRARQSPAQPQISLICRSGSSVQEWFKAHFQRYLRTSQTTKFSCLFCFLPLQIVKDSSVLPVCLVASALALLFVCFLGTSVCEGKTSRTI